MKIKAAVTHEKGAPFVIEEVELAPPQKHEILVKIVACGVCHTDEAVQQQFIPVPLPAVLGHEGCGIVEAVGPDVTEFQVGDKVGISFGHCCTCRNCRTAHPNACVHFNEINFGGVQPDGTTRLSLPDGTPVSTFFGQSTFATHAVVNEAAAVKVPYDDIDLALVGPMGCGIQTGAGAVLNRLRPEFGSSIAVFGCGTVGMSAIMAAKIAGCEKIIAVGGNDASLALALELGATHTINRKRCGDIAGEIRTITGSGADFAVETSGVPSMVQTALSSLNYLGRLAPAGGTFGMGEFMLGGKSLVGVTEGYSNPKIFIPQMIAYQRQGRFPIEKLMKFYSFDQINEAFDDSNSGRTIKAVLVRREV